MRSMIGARIGLAALAASIAMAAWGQGFNIDVDSPFATQQEGGGVPSSQFGAAAGAAGVGFWNGIVASGSDPVNLHDWSGSLTDVVCSMTEGGAGGGFDFLGNTGDFAALLNDCRNTEPGEFWQLGGLAPGSYEVYVYAAKPMVGVYNPTEISVSSDGGSQTLSISGPMPGNQFVLGITHQVFSAAVVDGPLTITVGESHDPNSWVNGFQVVPVPEPASLVPILGGICLLRRRRYKRVAA